MPDPFFFSARKGIRARYLLCNCAICLELLHRWRISSWIFRTSIMSFRSSWISLDSFSWSCLSPEIKGQPLRASLSFDHQPPCS